MPPSKMPAPSPADAASSPGNKLPPSTGSPALLGAWRSEPEPTSEAIIGSRGFFVEDEGKANSSSLLSSTVGKRGCGRRGEMIGETANGNKSSMRAVLGHGSHSMEGYPTNTFARVGALFQFGVWALCT